MINSSDTVLTAEGVSKVFGNLVVVDNVNLAVKRGERMAIIGASGSGKSTLCRLFAGLEQPDEGSIFVNGERLASGSEDQKSDRERRRLRSKLGFVPQQYTLFPHLTLTENISLGPTRVLNLSKSDALDVTKVVLKKVGLEDKFNSYPAQLSGGQRQRGAIARELAMQRDVLIFDEPTSALDPDLSAEVREVMSQLAREGLTMLVITHEMEFARKFSDRIATMSKGKLVSVKRAADAFDSHESA